MNPSSRRLLLGTALAYTVFVIYGSLVPLDFRPLPLAEALARFQAMPYLTLGIGSRADWVANILLFIPLAFLWLGVVWHHSSRPWRLAATLAVGAASVLLSVAIEFAQLYFPPRTVSLNDILAESLGAVGGVALWWVAGERLVAWVGGWREAHGPLARHERLLALWLCGLFFYNVLPLDLTISPVELYHKFRAGRVVMLPFAGLPADPSQALYDLITDVALWIPAAWLWRAGGASRARAVGNTVAAAALLEFLQLWVYSRVTDVTDVLTAALGGFMGAILPRRGEAIFPRAAAAALLGAWVVVLVGLFWYPFDFRADGPFLSQRLAGLPRVPFAAYYFGTEYRAATEVLHKLLFFVPLGWLAARAGCKRGAALVLSLAVAALLEGGQFFLPGKHADLTDWLIEGCGGGIGVWLSGWLAKGTLSPTVLPARASQRPRRGLRLIAVWWGLAAFALVGTRLPSVPYNVRELLGEHALLSSLALSLAMLWIVGFPAWLARAGDGRRGLAWLPAGILLHGVFAFALLRLAVPIESLYDVVGSPTLDWPGESEIVARFLGLFAAVSAAAFPAASLALGAPRPVRWLAIALACPLVVTSYAVVVLAANTDNLTELLAHSARWDAFLWVWLAGFVTALAGYGLAAWIDGRRVRWLPWAVLGAGPVAWVLLAFGLEPTLVKYGRVFSALQFLLSTDRAHYASDGELVLRFGLAWWLAVSVTAAVTAVLPAPQPGTGRKAKARPAPQPRPVP
ncbi:VanZ family protein [Thiobacter aerophilum]|uniref:VanZ family protein n=1 Tax=Thiobacter aerophilum TaxID=3121275 RepID=A0ABV0EF94_9BURK